MAKVTEIKGTIETADGRVTGFRIFRDGGWQQGTVEITTEQAYDQLTLGTRVGVLEAMSHALMDDELLETSDDD